jgi:transposase
MAIYAGIDLHSNSNFLSVDDSAGKIIEKRKLANEVQAILHPLAAYREQLQGIAIESTFNWYWIVDALMDEGYQVHLANPAAIQKYSGLKHSDDASDAAWLAEMLRLGVLPEGYIYPKAERPIRDLLRKRGHLVRLRTSLITSLQGIVSRNNGHSLPGRMIKQLKTNHVAPLCAANEDLALCGEVSKDTIDYLGRQIKKIEKQAEERIELRPAYKALLSMPGVGVILGLTIMLETGPIGRFAKAGNFSSYCRKVPFTWISNGKRKGKGNTKNGNKYLAWAFSEVAEFARRYDDASRSWYDRKLARSNRMVAHSALAHKLARAAYFIMREGVNFDHEKCFA